MDNTLEELLKTGGFVSYHGQRMEWDSPTRQWVVFQPTFNSQQKYYVDINDAIKDLKR